MVVKYMSLIKLLTCIATYDFASSSVILLHIQLSQAKVSIVWSLVMKGCDYIAVNYVFAAVL